MSNFHWLKFFLYLLGSALVYVGLNEATASGSAISPLFCHAIALIGWLLITTLVFLPPVDIDVDNVEFLMNKKNPVKIFSCRERANIGPIKRGYSVRLSADGLQQVANDFYATRSKIGDNINDLSSELGDKIEPGLRKKIDEVVNQQLTASSRSSVPTLANDVKACIASEIKKGLSNLNFDYDQMATQIASKFDHTNQKEGGQ